MACKRWWGDRWRRFTIWFLNERVGDFQPIGFNVKIRETWGLVNGKRWRLRMSDLNGKLVE